MPRSNGFAEKATGDQKGDHIFHSTVKPAVSGSGRSRGKQTRVLLLSLPLRAEAADAETVGGLPASAFLLAALPGASSTVYNDCPEPRRFNMRSADWHGAFFCHGEGAFEKSIRL